MKYHIRKIKKKVDKMLETPKERAELLKKGISGKGIEMLYIEGNNFKIVEGSVPIEFEIIPYKSAI